MVNNPNVLLEKVGYKIQAAPATKIITAAGDTTYSFGIDAQPADGENAVLSRPKFSTDIAYTYDSREVASSTTIINRDSFTGKKNKIIPTLAVPWYLLEGSVTDAAPDTFQVLDSGLKKSVTLHGEFTGGSDNKYTRDLVGAYLTRMSWHMEIEKPLMIDEMAFTGSSIQDEDSTVASVHLTNDPTLQNSNAFIGIEEVKWDTGGDNETLNNAYKVDFETTQEFTASKITGAGANRSRIVYPGKFEKHKILVSCVLDTHNQYDDLRDQNQINASFKSFKNDQSDYIKFLATGLDVTDITAPIPVGGGYSKRVLICEANSLSGEFDDGLGAGDGTYYP